VTPRTGVGAILFPLATACAPPPLVELTGESPDGPSIEILYPEPEQQLALDSSCVLTEPIVVNVEGVELSAPTGEIEVGIAHWHGGPSLTEGYCSSSVAFCVGAPTGTDKKFYDGSGRRPGQLTLQVSLRDGTHSPLGPVDEVEVTIVDPEGLCADATL
jgi:hypothetical protein